MNGNNSKIRRMCRLAYTLGKEGNYPWDEVEDHISRLMLAKAEREKATKKVPSETGEGEGEAPSPTISR